LKIYDENEDDVDAEKILENTKIMTIIVIQGIKCSSRSFQIEYEIKQMMLLNPVDIFEKCLFPIKKKTIEESSIQKNDLGKLKEKIESTNTIQPDLEDIKNDNTELTLDLNLGNGNGNEMESSLFLKNEDLEEEKNDLAKIINQVDNDLCEIDLVIPENNEEDTLKLKNRNAVYFEMYREAKRKAKLARDFALSAYLEAKRIKNTYLMDEAFVSDDENDLEEKSLENVF
jgi:seryl-tRNA synthetase